MRGQAQRYGVPVRSSLDFVVPRELCVNWHVLAVKQLENQSA
jgi:hypothetical protein